MGLGLGEASERESFLFDLIEMKGLGEEGLLSKAKPPGCIPNSRSAGGPPFLVTLLNSLWASF